MSNLLAVALTFILVACQVEKKSGKDDYIADHRPATNSFSIQNAQSGTFKTGDILNFTLSFPSNVLVTGFPRLALEIDSTTRYATYVSGDGSKNLNFSYTIQSTDNDDNGIKFLGINLNDDALQFYLKDELTDCSTSMKEVHYKNILIDNASPVITKITHAHLPGPYYWNDELTFTVHFNEKVIVTGDPTLRVNIGGLKDAKLISGSGTQNLNFQYKIEKNVADTNGFNFSAINLAGGSIKDKNGNDATLTIPETITPTNGLKVDGRVPKLTEVILPADGVYKVSQHLDFHLVFDRDVDITGISPQLALTVGTTTHQALLIGGGGSDTLTFRYTPLPGHVDLDGITLNNSITNANSIVAGTIPMTTLVGNNDLKNPDTSQIIISAIQPAIERISRGTDITSRVDTGARDDVWIIGQQLHLIAEFNTNIDVNIDNGSPTLHFAIGGVPKVATYLTGGAGADTMTFVYTVQEGDESTGSEITISNIQLNDAVVLDEAGTIPDLTIPNTTVTDTTIDGIRPIIKEITPPDNGFYSDEQTQADFRSLRITAEFSEPVNLSNNQISIPIVIGGNTRQATLSAGNNTATPVFSYNIVNNDNDSDGVAIQSPINTSGSTYVIKDLAGNEMVTKTFAAPATPNVIVDTTHPGASLTGQPASRVYLKGETLTLEITFNEIVTINTTAAYPRIRANNVSPARYFTPNFPSGTQGTVFEFTYQIQPGDLATNPITLGAITNGGGSWIRDRANNNLPATTLSLTNTITVDAQDVTITSRNSSDSGYYRKGDILEINLTFSENVFVTNGTPSIIATKDGVDYEFELTAGDGTNTLTFSYIITDDELLLDGLDSVSSVTLNGSFIKDNNGIDAIPTFPALNLSGLKILPESFLAWGQGSLTDVISGNAGVFTGSLSLDGSNTLETTQSASRIMTRVTFASSTGTILGGIEYSESTELNLKDQFGKIQKLYVNGTEISRTGNEFNLGINSGESFILEVLLSAPISGTLFDTDFMGQISSILLLDSSPLSVADRASINSKLN
ncbi:MAG TPA: hypothetical protein VKY27_07220 [Bacteriovoracaceae bacterium]|nr:hypothetical protein [Bacteriovoracaceae bacterium]